MRVSYPAHSIYTMPRLVLCAIVGSLVLPPVCLAQTSNKQTKQQQKVKTPGAEQEPSTSPYMPSRVGNAQRKDRQRDLNEEGRGNRASGRRSSPKSLSEAEREKLQAFIEEHFPFMYEELRDFHNKNPERFERRLRKLAPEIYHLMELIEIDPQRARLIIQERRLDMRIRFMVHRYRLSHAPEDRKRLRKKVREFLENAFDIRLKRRELEIRDMEARIAELRDRLETLETLREVKIDRQLAELLSDKSTQDRHERRMQTSPLDVNEPNTREKSRGHQDNKTNKAKTSEKKSKTNRQRNTQQQRRDKPPLKPTTRP